MNPTDSLVIFHASQTPASIFQPTIKLKFLRASLFDRRWSPFYAIDSDITVLSRVNPCAALFRPGSVSLKLLDIFPALFFPSSLSVRRDAIREHDLFRKRNEARCLAGNALLVAHDRYRV